MADGNKTASSSSSKRTITLKSNLDGELVEVDIKVAMESQFIKKLVEDDLTDSTLKESTPVFINATGRALALLTEYCMKRVELRDRLDVDGDKDKTEAYLRGTITSFHREFANKLENAMDWVELSRAAYYMAVPDLLEFSCQTVAKFLPSMSVEEVRTLFNIKNDFTPEEEAEIIRAQNADNDGHNN
ncbi:SKP1 component [Macleaya cordata]|uniref:SKP1-like protein n=1 Tax=Macleaya cordata TaxID=56857 RepID=A0A200Q240_MACCD|nr:SKP1 component [Macleaya cordata]OVA04523.1 SKP1 component [Macleaya cordata]